MLSSSLHVTGHHNQDDAAWGRLRRVVPVLTMGWVMFWTDEMRDEATRNIRRNRLAKVTATLYERQDVKARNKDVREFTLELTPKALVWTGLNKTCQRHAIRVSWSELYWERKSHISALKKVSAYLESLGFTRIIAEKFGVSALHPKSE